MSYRLIDTNALIGEISYEDYEKVQNAPCIYADLPNEMDGGMYLAIPAHEGMTNGDMIKAMVKLESIATDGTYVYLDVKTGKTTAGATIEMSWWKAPYKGGK